MVESSTFSVIVNGSKPFKITINSGLYWLAAFAALAQHGNIEAKNWIEIWVDDLLPDYGPYNYMIDRDGKIYNVFKNHKQETVLCNL